MDFFFKPKGVAIVGATANPLKGGYYILKNLSIGFKGGIYPVNPRYQEIEGIPCFDTVLDVPDPVDLAIVFLPAQATVKAVKECAERGIKGVMIQSAGFAETGPLGRRLQDDLLKIQEATGMRLWGPNCMGLVDAVNRQVFSFVLPRIWDDGLMPGNVSLIVQSGMLSAGFLIDTVSHGTMGLSKACSIGNKVDVNECDILEYLIQDTDTEAIAAYLESIAEGKRFLDICRKTDKPIIVLKGGKSAKGAKAAMSHTSSLAGDHAVISGALAQANVVEANDFKQMIDLARTLSTYRRMKPPAKNRIAVLTYSGSAGIVSADFMAQMGLQVADLSLETLETIQEVFPPWMPPSNPVDLWPAIEKNGPQKVYETTFKAVCSDPNVDAVFFHVFIGGIIKDAGISVLADIARKHEKPLFVWLLGGREEAHQFQLLAQDLSVPVYREIHRAIECMAAAFKFWERS